MRHSSTRRVLHSTSTPTAERLLAPLMRSPSQCPGMSRSSASGGRTWLLTMSGICPRRSWPAERGGARCGPGAARRAVASSTPRGDRRRWRCRSFRGTRSGVFHRDACAAVCGQSAEATSARAGDRRRCARGGCADAAWVQDALRRGGPGRQPGQAARHNHHQGGCCVPAHGIRCWGCARAVGRWTVRAILAGSARPARGVHRLQACVYREVIRASYLRFRCCTSGLRPPKLFS